MSVLELETTVKDKGTTISFGKRNLRFVILKIIEIVNSHYKNIEDFAAQFDTGDLYSTAKKIWDYIHYSLHYVKDDFGKEQIRTPERTINDRRGDCEDFAILAAAILKALGYNPYFYIVSFDGVGWQHIFLGVDDIIVDPVHTAFNEFPPGIVKSFTVGLDGKIPYEVDTELQGVYVSVLEGFDPLEDFAHLIQGWDQQMNPIFDEEDIPDVEHYIDVLNGTPTLGEIGRIRLRLRRKKGKKTGRKKTSKKIGKWLKQKGLAPARAAYLLFLKLNILNQAAKLYIGYLTPQQAKNIGVDSQTYNKLKAAVRKLENFWVKAGGRLDVLRKAIKQGKGAKKVKKTFGLSGLGSIGSKAKMFWKYVENQFKKLGVKYTNIKRMIKKNSDKKLDKARSAFLRLLRKNHKGVSAILYLAYLPQQKVAPVIGKENYTKIKNIVSALEQYWKQKGGNIKDLRNAIVSGGKNKLGLGEVATAAAAATTVTASAPFWKKVLDWLKGIKWKDVAKQAKNVITQVSQSDVQKNSPKASMDADSDIPNIPNKQEDSQNILIYVVAAIAVFLAFNSKK